VFISSTSEELKKYRLAARDAALAAGFRPVMMEYFAASGGPPLSECLTRVSPCDMVVALVAHRYGWVPPDQPGGSFNSITYAKFAGEKRAQPPDQPGGSFNSITWLECEHAAGQCKDVLVFLADPDAEWPTVRKESYRTAAALEDGTFMPELIAEVQRNLAKLKDFRQWLENGRTRATFASPEGLRANVILALHRWLAKHPECQPTQTASPRDPQPYLQWLHEQTATIDIRGLGASSGKAHNFPIEDLYILLTTPREAACRGPGMEELAERQPMELQDALADPRLVIVGDPGSGKTTFLRRIAFALAGAAIEAVRNADNAGPLDPLLSSLETKQPFSYSSGSPNSPSISNFTANKLRWRRNRPNG
jgi:hypothetical protein